MSSDGADALPDSEPTSPSRLRQSITVERTSIRKRLFKDLAIQLETLIYLELTISYYLDNSFIRFLIRFFVHVWITGSSSSFNIETNPHSMFGHVIGANLLAIALSVMLPGHIIKESAHGYLNGNFLLDLIGQKANTSRLWMFIIDIIITFAQLMYLSVLQRERDNRLSIALLGSRSRNQSLISESRQQDIESEEMGLIRDDDVESTQALSNRSDSLSLQDVYYRCESLGTVWILDHRKLYQQYARLRKPDVRSTVLLLDRQ